MNHDEKKEKGPVMRVIRRASHPQPSGIKPDPVCQKEGPSHEQAIPHKTDRRKNGWDSVHRIQTAYSLTIGL
jgi:hypothetical protein